MQVGRRVVVEWKRTVGLAGNEVSEQEEVEEGEEMEVDEGDGDERQGREMVEVRLFAWRGEFLVGGWVVGEFERGE